MPNFVVEIPETQARITRPLVKQVTADIMKRFKDMPLSEFRYSDDLEDALITPGSALDHKKRNRSPADGWIDITVEDQADEDYSKSRPITGYNYHKFFECKRTLVDIYPMYMSRKLIITFKIQAETRVRVNGLVTRVKAAMDRDAASFSHMISYNYDLPPVVDALLGRVYELMQSNYPYEDLPYEKWFQESSIADNFDVSVQMNGKNPRHMVRENNVNVLSHLSDYSTEPRKQRGEEGGNYYIELELELKYQRPTEMRAVYPVLVHNQPMGDMWYNRFQGYDYRSHLASAPAGYSDMELFKYNLTYSHPSRTDVGVKEPIYDDWGKRQSDKNLRRLVSVLCAVDIGIPRTLFHPIDDLHDYVFNDGMVDLMRANPKALFNGGYGPLHCKVYSNNEVIRPEHLVFDECGNICLDYDLNPRKFYHIVFYLNTDLTTIPVHVWETLLCCVQGLKYYFGLYLDRAVTMIDEWLEIIEPDECGCKCLTLAMVKRIIDEIIKIGDPDGVGGGNGGGGFENSDPFGTGPMRTQLRYSVHGER